MWYQPVPVCRIPVEPSPNLVVDSSTHHSIQRFRDDCQCKLRTAEIMISSEEKKIGGARKFGRGTKSSILTIKGSREFVEAILDYGVIQRSVRRFLEIIHFNK